MRSTVLPLTVAAFMLVYTGCSKLPAATATSGESPVIAEIAKSFKSYKLITPKPVFVDPELAMLCRGANQSDVAAARATKGPHANTAVKIYMNESAARRFASGTGTYEPGAVIVKEKVALPYRVSPTEEMARDLSGVGGMVKRPPGFDPKHGDWEYFYFQESEWIEQGAIASCVKCHAGAKDKDYVFGTRAPPAQSSTPRRP